MLIKGGIGASIFLFLTAGACMIGMQIADYYDLYEFGYNCNIGMIGCGVLGIVVLILSLALHFSLEHSKARGNQPSNIILIKNGEAREVNPRDIPYYIEGNPQRELPSGRQVSNQPIKLDQQTLEALSVILNQQKRYIPSGKDDRSQEITEY